LGRASKVSLAVAAAIVAAVGTLTVTSTMAGAADPEDQLKCQSANRNTTVIDYAGDAPETRSPAEIAAGWRDHAVGEGKARLVSSRSFNASADLTKISYADAAGDVSVVLRFEKHPNGWRLSTIVACGEDK